MEDVDPKAVHFSRVATKHTRAALAAIKRLENLMAPRYHSTPEQRTAIVDALGKALDELIEEFEKDVVVPEPEPKFEV